MRASSLAVAFLLAAAALADEPQVTYSVRVDNLSGVPVTFQLDGTKRCTAPVGGNCIWDIGYGSHTVETDVAGRHVSRDFELSDESDIQVRCKFDGTKFSGDSC